jgi:calcineurin-like phosphoesterase family protein
MDMKEILARITLDSWIVSDTHLGHKNILSFEPCRLEQMLKDGYTEEEHNQWIIDNWNKTVKPGETVLHLGDFAFKGVANYIEQLNGNIIMVFGNHDDKPHHSKFDGLDGVDGFYWPQGELLNKVMHPDPLFSGFIKELNGLKLLFSHYPVFDDDDWDRKNKMIAPRIEVLETIYKANNCDANVHGHNHSKESTFKDSYNASFEHIGFKPIRLRDLIK